MNIKPIKRPWIANNQRRYNPDPYYQSQSWKRTRQSFRLGYTEWNGVRVPNTCCIDCYKEKGQFIPGANTDHIIRRKDGGSDEHDNLQTLCDSCHSRKSAIEGNTKSQL